MSKIKTPFFYGWVIIAAGFLINAIFGGGLYYSFGVFLPVMMAELGFSRGAGSTAFSIMLFIQAFASPLIGITIRRVGLKQVMIAGNLLMIAVMLLMSRVTQVWHIYIVYGIIAGFAILSSGYISTLTLMNNWFVRRRSLATGICISGVGVGTLILAPTYGYLIQSIGWRNTWLVLAGIATLLALLPTIFFIKSSPESMGLTPDGDTRAPSETRTSPGPAVIPPAEWGVKAALKTSAFWCIVALGTANGFCLNVLSTHQVAHLQDIGIPPIVAAGAIGLLVGVSTVGRLGGGIVGDHFPPRYVAALACAAQVIALIILINARSLPLIYLYAIIFGLAYGTILVVHPSLIGAYFGRRNYAAIFGCAVGISNLISAISPAFAGFIFDATQSYVIPFTTAAVFAGAAGICILLTRSPGAPQA